MVERKLMAMVAKPCHQVAWKQNNETTTSKLNFNYE